MKQLTREAIASMTDSTLLSANATVQQIEELCSEAKRLGFKAVVVNPCQVARAKSFLGDTPVKLGSVVGFPLGQSTIAAKLFEAKGAIDDGANEIDYVINVTELKDGNTDYIADEMKQIVALCRARDAVSKVIIETCFLTVKEIEAVCEIARNVRPTFVKTSTGFGTGGATVENIRIMRRIVGDHVRIKASGGIGSLETFSAMVNAGADRIGTSHAAEIIAQADR